MGLDAQHVLDVSLRQADQSAEQVEANLRNGEFFVARNYLFGIFENSLLAGLVQWRTGISSPLNSIQSALAAAIRAAEIAPSIVAEFNEGVAVPEDVFGLIDRIFRRQLIKKKKKPMIAGKTWWFFDFGAAAFLSILIEGKPNAGLVEASCKPTDWDQTERNHWRSFVESFVITKILNLHESDDYSEIKSFAQAKSPMYLQAFETYIDLIDATQRHKRTDSMRILGEATAQFLDRQKTETTFRAYDGGGEYNPITVDFRLAAITKFFASELDFQNETLHQWRW